LGGIPSPEFYNLPNGCQILYSIFFGRVNELHIYHRNFLLMDTEHKKLFVIKQSKWCKFKPKMHQNTFGGRASPGHDGGAYAPPEPLSAIRGRKGGERGRKGRGREFPPPEVSVSRIDINHESYVGVVSAVVACLSVTSSHAVTS